MEIKKITHVDKIQFKRTLDYKGTYAEAVAAVKAMNPPLKSGEPMIVSFREEETSEKYSYFLAIGRNIRSGKKIVSSPVVTPFFADITENITDVYKEYFNKYIKDSWHIQDIADWQTDDTSANVSDKIKLVIDEDGELAIAVISNEGDTNVEVITNQVNNEGEYVDIDINKIAANDQKIPAELKDLYSHDTPGLEFDDEGNAIIKNMGTYVAVTQEMIDNVFNLINDNTWEDI